MNGEEFVSSLMKYVIESAVEITLKRIRNAPTKDYTQLSHWFNGLSETDQHSVEDALKEASRLCLFGFCAVLDGSRSFDSARPQGRLELYYVRNDERLLVNGPKQPQLMDFVPRV